MRYFTHHVLSNFFMGTSLFPDPGSAFVGEYSQLGFAFVPSWTGFKHKHGSTVT